MLCLMRAACVAVLLVCASGARAQSAEPQPEPIETIHPWERLGAGLEGIYGWPNTLFHVAAVATTPPLVYWADEPVQEYFQEQDPLGNALGPVTLIVGGVAPFIVPGTLYFGGLVVEDTELATAGAALVQAMVVQAVVVTTLKWLTDRRGPYPNGDPNEERWNAAVFQDSKSAKDFNFNPFDLTGGLRWPSGHTASNVALVSTLVAFYPDELWIALVGYPAALAIGIGMIEGDYHWLSDVVAGALMGHVIGWVIGAEFRAAYDAQRKPTLAKATRASELSLSFAPMTEAFGARAFGRF
jgi:membrane-associated phospholipid phosphatase